MSTMQTPFQRRSAWLAATGALYAAASVALAAYAAHALQGPAQSRLQTAAVFAFGHGIALAALAPAATRRLGCIALTTICAGTLLFSGSLACNVLARWPTTLAPLGGTLLIGGWLAFSVDCLRHRA